MIDAIVRPDGSGACAEGDSVRPCPVCAGHRAWKLRDMHYLLFDDTTLPAHTEIRRCAGCRFVYADSRAAPQDYLAHYRNSIYAATDTRAGAGLCAGDRDRLERAARRMAPWLKADDLFIDVGAGGGGLLHAVGRATGCRLLGIDPDPRCVAALSGQGLEAMPGTLGSLPAALHGKAALVALSHVLEHLFEPRQGLEQALALLAPGGLVYLETPDRAGYAQCPNAPFYYFDPEHINHFTDRDLAGIARSVGAACLVSGRDTIRLSDGTPYPVCWALVGRRPEADGAATPPAAPHDRLACYIDGQEAALRREIREIRARVAAVDGPVLVWGTGSHAQRLLAAGCPEPARILGFVDSDASKQGRRLRGLPVLAPEEGLRRHPDAPIVILAARAAEAAIRIAVAARWPLHPVVGAVVADAPEASGHA